MNLRMRRSMLLLAAMLLLPAGFAAAQTVVGRGGPAQAQIYVTSNVQGATVALNNAVVGTTPYTRNLTPGTYTVTVQAAGYQDYNATVTVAGQVTVNAYLQPINYSFTVNSNVNGANVYINGQQMGQAPYTIALAPGSYLLRVTAPGYQDYSAQVTVNQNSTVNASLQPMLAIIHIRIPDQFLNFQSDQYRNDRGRARAAIRVFVDNQQINRPDFQLPAGNHTISFVSGAFMVSQSFYFSAGQNYTVSPMLSISVQ